MGGSSMQGPGGSAQPKPSANLMAGPGGMGPQQAGPGMSQLAAMFGQQPAPRVQGGMPGMPGMTGRQQFQQPTPADIPQVAPPPRYTPPPPVPAKPPQQNWQNNNPSRSFGKTSLGFSRYESGGRNR